MATVVNIIQIVQIQEASVILCRSFSFCFILISLPLQDLSFVRKELNDTHMEELDSVQKFIEIQGCLLLMFFICLHNQLIFFNSIIVQMSEKQIHQVDSKNEWLFLSETFTAKLELVFVLTFENAFS